MKPKILGQISAALGITCGAIAISAKPSLAQDRFSCDVTQMSTIVSTERGSVPLIRWIDRSFPPPFTPEQRCEIVSQRFRKFDRNGTLKYIKADEINNLPVLCIAAYKGGSCLPDGLLVTFKPGTDANDALVKILDRRVWAAGDPLKFSSAGDGNSETVVSQVNGETYVDLELFLDWTE
ncbi:MAG: COP23 domain-containing protein [Cyanobacteria bacterium P01_E01_bin.35]